MTVTIRPKAVLTEDMQACIDRYHAYQTHDFDDETGYCTACGQQDEYAIRNAIHCFGQPGVIAISHLRRPPTEPDASVIWNSPT